MLPDTMTDSFDDLANTDENCLGLVVCCLFYFDIIALIAKCISAFSGLEIIN